MQNQGKRCKNYRKWYPPCNRTFPPTSAINLFLRLDSTSSSKGLHIGVLFDWLMGQMIGQMLNLAELCLEKGFEFTRKYGSSRVFCVSHIYFLLVGGAVRYCKEAPESLHQPCSHPPLRRLLACSPLITLAPPNSCILLRCLLSSYYPTLPCAGP